MTHTPQHSISPASYSSPATMNHPPPFISKSYDSRDALDDIPGIHWALHEFLHSRMLESEEYCHRVDPNKCAATTGL